jgi:hypothetical protein
MKKKGKKKKQRKQKNQRKEKETKEKEKKKQKKKKVQTKKGEISPPVQGDFNFMKMFLGWGKGYDDDDDE